MWISAGSTSSRQIASRGRREVAEARQESRVDPAWRGLRTLMQGQAPHVQAVRQADLAIDMRSSLQSPLHSADTVTIESWSLRTTAHNNLLGGSEPGTAPGVRLLRLCFGNKSSGSSRCSRSAKRRSRCFGNPAHAELHYAAHSRDASARVSQREPLELRRRIGREFCEIPIRHQYVV